VSNDIAARLDEIADQDTPDWATYEALACASIDAASSWSDLEATLSESLQESLFGEHDGSPRLAHSLVAAASRMPPEDAVKTLGLIVRAATFDPRHLLRVPYRCPKPQFSRGISEQKDAIREAWVRAGTSDVSAPLLLVLLASAATDASDLAVLLPHLKGKDPSAAALLGATLIAARHGLEPAPVVAAARRWLAKLPKKTTADKQWRTTAAVIAIVLLGAEDEHLRAAATDVLSRSAAAPSHWGISDSVGATSAEWLIAVLTNAPEGPLRLAELIRPIATAPLATPVAAAQHAELLVGLAFRDPIDPRGLLLGALDDAQRAVLEALRSDSFQNAHTAIRKLGFWSRQSLVDFSNQTGSHYRALSVEKLEEGPVYPLYVWRSIARGDLDLETGLQALRSQLDVHEIAELMFLRTDRPITKLGMRSQDDWDREHALVLDLLAWLEEDASFGAILQRFAAPGPHEYAFVAEALLRAAYRGALVLGPEHDEAIVQGLLSARVKSTLLPLVKQQARAEQWLARAG
jgi:hypothetical protein